MELIKLPKLDHSKDSLSEVFGLTRYQEQYVKSAIIFEVLSTHILAQKLFSNPEEIPNDLKTMSGVMERALAHSKSPEEQMFLMLKFESGYYSIAKNLMEESNPPKKKKETGDAKSDIGSLLSQLVDKIKFLPIQQTSKMIEECNHDFDTFIERVMPKDKFKESSSGLPNDIDALIKQALGDSTDFSIEFGSDEDDDD